MKNKNKLEVQYEVVCIHDSGKIDIIPCWTWEEACSYTWMIEEHDKLKMGHVLCLKTGSLVTDNIRIPILE